MALKMRKNQSVSKMIYVTDNITDDITMLYQKVIKQEYCHCALSHHTTGMRTKTDDGCHQQIVMFTLCWQHRPSVPVVLRKVEQESVLMVEHIFQHLKPHISPGGVWEDLKVATQSGIVAQALTSRLSHYRSFWMIVTNDMLRNQISDANLHCVPY